jgi:regulator of protease activity HflC (stomatin/prohibitin superfamily)
MSPVTQTQYNKVPGWSPVRIFLAALVGLVLLVMLLSIGSLFESLDAEQVMVIQSPVSGELTYHVTPGMKWQGAGRVTKYPRRTIYEFKIPIRFNDGGHATMHGSVQYEMPLDVDHLRALHLKFGSPEAIQHQLIETVVNKSIYMTGPLMSSKESYAEKRNYLISYVEDQISKGVYKTTQKEVKTKDAMTGQDKTVTIVEIVLKDGMPERQEEAVLESFGIKTFNFAVVELPYDDTVEKQIKSQQDLIMQVQTAIADAKRAEQASITAEKNGQAEAAKAKWEQEVIKAKEVTKGEQLKAVAKLSKEAAEFTKAEQILLGEGEAARKKLVMAADGALQPKLAAWIEAQKVWAEAIKGGRWVPEVVMGEGQRAGSGATDLVSLLMAKTAKDLALDMQMSGAGATAGKK